eukprot:IDg22040t1
MADENPGRFGGGGAGPPDEPEGMNVPPRPAVGLPVPIVPQRAPIVIRDPYAMANPYVPAGPAFVRDPYADDDFQPVAWAPPAMGGVGPAVEAVQARRPHAGHRRRPGRAGRVHQPDLVQPLPTQLLPDADSLSLVRPPARLAGHRRDPSSPWFVAGRY